jgi:hypothetical protein
MFTRLMLASLLVTVAATGVAHAQPGTPDLSDERMYDRFDHILHPDEEVGPKIDPDNPLKPPVYHEIVDIEKILNGPNPAEIAVHIVVVR